MVKYTHLLLGMPAEKCSAQEEFCMVRREGEEGEGRREGEGEEGEEKTNSPHV